MYHPLLVFDGRDGFPLAAVLRPGNTHSSRGALANQFRLLLHTAAYCLFWLLRHPLQGTELATAQVHTLRLKLLKIGARIRETSRRIWVHLASGYPYRDLLAGLLQNLRASPG